MYPRSRRDLRLASGLVLFTYVTLHLLCHALGLISLATAEAALHATVLVWQSWPGTALLYGAAAVHVGLALLAIFDRRTLRLPPLQLLRIVLGLLIPATLIGHVVATRYAVYRFGLPPEYSRVVANLWASGAQGLSLGLLAPGWLHGCLGLRFAFGTRAAWQRARPALFGVALLLPVLAALGFVTMGRELASAAGRTQSDDYGGAAPAATAHVTAPVLRDVRGQALAAYFGLLGLVIAARALRSLEERRRKTLVRISYPERSVRVPRGWSVLEASHSFGIPHLSVCGGRARCTTCRVRVEAGEANCPPPAIEEQRALERIDAAGTLRLACQLRPTGDIAVEPVLQVERSGWQSAPPRPTRDRRVAVLFFDVRLRPGRDEGRVSAHDSLHVLERCDAMVTATLAAAGGVRCRQAGGHWLALLGLDGGAQAACGHALAAARRIDDGSAKIAEGLARELGLRIVFSLGVHFGPVVTTTAGAGAAGPLLAVGDAIDEVERLRAFAASEDVGFMISEAAATAAGIDAAALAWRVVGADTADMPLRCAQTSLQSLPNRRPGPA